MTENQTPPDDPPAKADEKDPARKPANARPDRAPTDPEKARTVHGDEEAVV
ncbi:MAG: hypothetical protein ABJB93_10880 [Gaiellales bacterium]